MAPIKPLNRKSKKKYKNKNSATKNEECHKRIRLENDLFLHRQFPEFIRNDER